MYCSLLFTLSKIYCSILSTYRLTLRWGGMATLIFCLVTILSTFVAHSRDEAVVVWRIVTALQLISVTLKQQIFWCSSNWFNANLALHWRYLHGNCSSITCAKSSNESQRLLPSIRVRPQTGHTLWSTELSRHLWQNRWSSGHWRIGGTMYWPQTRHSYNWINCSFNFPAIFSIVGLTVNTNKFREIVVFSKRFNLNLQSLQIVWLLFYY